MSDPQHPQPPDYFRLQLALQATQEVLKFVSDSLKQISDLAGDVDPSKLGGESLLNSMARAKVEPRLSLVKLAEALKFGELPKSRNAKASGNGQAGQPGSVLSGDFTFELFETSAANKLVVGVSKEFVDALKTGPNSLLMTAAVGVGKTHLLHAIGNSARARYPQLKVCYTSTDRLIEQMITAYQEKSFQSFQHRYADLDLLLLDDMDGLMGRERTQEELTRILDDMVEKGASIVLAGRCHPKDMQNMQQRLRSRFAPGWVCKIEPPDQETKVAMLHRKAHRANTRLPDDVAAELARRLIGDVRELEGALRNITAFAKIHQCELDLSLIVQATGLPSPTNQMKT